MCVHVCVLNSGHKDIKRGMVSVHKLEHLGFNLSHSELAASGHLMRRSSVFIAGLDDSHATVIGP